MARFDLSGLLRLRRLQQDRAQLELARTRQISRENSARTRRVTEALGRDLGSPGTVESLDAIAAARASTASMLADLQALQVTLDGDVERAALAHQQARAAALGLEKLEERHHQREAAEALADEQKNLDELAGRAFFERTTRAAETQGGDER
jgi:flagellar protein FliJ